MSKDKIYWAKVSENATIPYKREEDGGYDLYACFDKDFIVIMPKEKKLIPTGIATAFSNDRVGIVKERGSTGFNKMAVRAGVIDSGFRGEWKVIINNTGNVPIVITKSRFDDKMFDEYIEHPYKKAIAQVVFPLIPHMETVEINYDELCDIDSERGDGMMGSSDK